MLYADILAQMLSWGIGKSMGEATCVYWVSKPCAFDLSDLMKDINSYIYPFRSA